jgi:hypothetical protein
VVLTLSAVEIGVPQQRPAPFTEISLGYPDTPARAARNVVLLWRADLGDEGVPPQPGAVTIDPGDCAGLLEQVLGIAHRRADCGALADMQLR